MTKRSPHVRRSEGVTTIACRKEATTIHRDETANVLRKSVVPLEAVVKMNRVSIPTVLTRLVALRGPAVVRMESWRMTSKGRFHSCPLNSIGGLVFSGFA